MILDATHLCDDSFWEALDHFRGPVWASHSNCRALVPHNRQFTDEQIRELIDRGAVIGAAFDAWMIVPGWVRGKTTPESAGVTLETMVDHIDHICQLAGNARHMRHRLGSRRRVRQGADARRPRHHRRPGDACPICWARAATARRTCCHRTRQLHQVPSHCMVVGQPLA